MSRGSDLTSRLQRRYLDVPARWTEDQPNFLRFSFPSSPTPALPAPPAVEASTTSSSSHPAKLARIRERLLSFRVDNRHFAISGVFSSLETGWPTSRILTLRFGRNRQPLDCVVVSPADGDGDEGPTLAYIDQEYILWQWHLAKAPEPWQTVEREHVEPYITALLIAVAQAQNYQGRNAYTTSSVLFTRNPRAPSMDKLETIHIYTAKIPRQLLEFLRRPKAFLPAYDPISVSWIPMPIEPLESLRERVFLAIRDLSDRSARKRPTTDDEGSAREKRQKRRWLKNQ